MPCPLYTGLTSGNPLKICGPRERLGYAPSHAHLKLLCLSTSAFRQCPNYKLKTKNWKNAGWWHRLLYRLSTFIIN